MINIVFDLFITNEYGVEVKVTDNIHKYKETREVGSIYNVCEFTLVDFDLPKRLSRDGVLRIRVEREIDGKSYSDKYIIDDLKISHKGQILIVGKTSGALLFIPYSQPKSEMLNHSTYNDLLSFLLGSISHTMYLSDIPNSTVFYEVTNETYGSVIVSLCDKLGIDVFIDNEKIIFEEMKTISPNASAVMTMEQKATVSASETVKDNTGVGIIEINIEGAEIVSETSMALSIAIDPQPVRPFVPRSWIDPLTLDEYNIVPQTCKMMLFYNPLNIGQPCIQGGGFALSQGFLHVEEFDLVDESCVKLLGGVLNIAGVTITDGSETMYTRRPSAQYNAGGDDTLVFDGLVSMGQPLYSMNGASVSVIDSGLDQAISSTLTGTGTDVDPYDYTILLGSQENIAGAKAQTIVAVESMYAYSKIRESLTFTGIAESSALNGHTIIIDGTGNTATSGFNLSAGSTVFYLDPNHVYDSVAKTIYEIIQNNTFPYTASINSLQSNVVVRPVVAVVPSGQFAGGVDGVYNGQRDNKAISEFVTLDSLAMGLYSMGSSTSTANPSELPSKIYLAGGSGFAGSIENFPNTTFECGHNVVCFNEKVTGTVRIAYCTNVFISEVPNSDYVKNIPINISFIDTFIKHTHKIRAVDYFPLSYQHRLDITDVWSMPFATARYTNIFVYKVDNYTGATTKIDTIQSDSTGIAMVWLGKYGYGQYALSISGFQALFIKFYANTFDISFDKVIIKPADSMGC